MTTTVYADLEQGTDAWFEARCGILTASVIGKLLTPTLKTANNDTSRGIILSLAAERITGHVEYVHPNFDMMRGVDDEPHARDAYSEHHAPVEEVGFIKREEAGYTLGYSPDGLVGDYGLIEIKSRNPKAQLATILSDDVPAANMAQLQAGLLVTGRKFIDYVSFSQGLPLWVRRVYPIDEWQDAIFVAAVEAESSIAKTVADFRTLTDGLPVMERRPDLIDTITF